MEARLSRREAILCPLDNTASTGFGGPSKDVDALSCGSRSNASQTRRPPSGAAAGLFLGGAPGLFWFRPPDGAQPNPEPVANASCSRSGARDRPHTLLSRRLRRLQR